MSRWCHNTEILNLNHKEVMEERWDDRTRRLIGDEGVDRLAQARVLVVGVGGVGGYAV